MKNITHALIGSAILLSSASALAQNVYRDRIDPYPRTTESAEQGKPLMVIRYNQQNVYYQLPLFNTVQKALQVKPNAQFSFVSKIPVTGHPQEDSDAEAQAKTNWEAIWQTLQDMGLPEKQINIRFEQTNQLLRNEVLMFVQ